MALLQADNLVKYYGAVPILQGVTLEINSGEKWGLIGRNGCGKTTLINILTGLEDYDSGEIAVARHVTRGYLPQHPEFKNGTVYQELRSLFTELDQIQGKITEIQERMADPALEMAALNSLIGEFHSLNEEFEQMGGYQLEGRIQGVLRGLGFAGERWADPPTCLSGGERTRLALARLLLMDYDLLFLDEPTNYLDVAAIEWLENFLSDFKGAVLLVSHDRHFLDKVVRGFWEIEFGKIARFKGNYAAYRLQKQALYREKSQAFERRQKIVEKQTKFIREARATEKSKRQADSIAKRLAKMERIAKPLLDEKRIKLEFTAGQASSRQVLEVSGIRKKYGDQQILNGTGFKLEAGEKVGLIGPNGAGKTTLLRIVLGLEQPDAGAVRLGYEVCPGYFSQLETEAELIGTPFDQIMAAADLSNTEARTILGRFLFSGEAVFKEAGDLSGGERRRLRLLRLMLSKANFLIIDEPTNHLDLDSIEVVEEALADFDGALLAVSHDRCFLEHVVHRYLALVDGNLYPFSDFQEYLSWNSQREAKKEEADKPKSEARLRRESNKETQRRLRRGQRELETLEAEIELIEDNRTRLLQELNDSAINADYLKCGALNTRLIGLEETLKKYYQRWELLQNKLNEFEGNSAD